MFCLSNYLPACLPACLHETEQIVMKFDIGEFHENLVAYSNYA
jgi:hypothetical protein